SLQFTFSQLCFACDGYSVAFAERAAGVIFDRSHPDDSRNGVLLGISRGIGVLRPDEVYARIEQICQRALASTDPPFSDVAISYARGSIQYVGRRCEVLQRWADGKIVVDREKVSDWLRSPEKRYEKFRSFGFDYGQLDTLIRYIVLSSDH